MKLAAVLFLCGSWAIPAIAQKPQPSAAAPLSGKAIYTQHCQTCHQVDGAGAPNMIPTLIKTDYVLGNKARLIGILLKGLKGDITVNRDPFAGEMPAQNALKDAEIAAVLTYIRTNFGNSASPVTSTDVKKVRTTNIK